MAEAAADAAAAQAPVFDDEDDAYGSNGKFTGYSDNSHGAYGQPPMTHVATGESYGMTEIMHPPYDPFGNPTGAGAAGVGVGAAMQRARSRKEIRDEIAGGPGMAAYDAGGVPPGYGEQAPPYPAFGGHQVPYNTAAPSGSYGPGNGTYDLMDAAGLGVARVPSQRYPNSGNSGYPDLSRSRSQGAKSLGGEGAYMPGPANGSGPEPPPGESYAARYQPGYQHQSPSPPLPMSTDDAYGGVGPSTPADPARPTSRDGSSSDYSDGDAYGGNADSQSLKDEEDYELERGKRVLKVSCRGYPCRCLADGVCVMAGHKCVMLRTRVRLRYTWTIKIIHLALSSRLQEDQTCRMSSSNSCCPRHHFALLVLSCSHSHHIL